MIDNQQNSSHPKKKILFVDPDMFSYCLISTILAAYDIEIIHTRSGPDAIWLFRQSPSIDIVITEIKLPFIDGFEILREIRKINPRITVIAQTACVHDNIMCKCMEAGFSDYISKPIDLKMFIKIINRHILQI